MEVQVRLQNNYIQVLREENGVKTFGGDQGFFAKTAQADKKEKRKRSSGCGVIALSDMLFYLGRKRKELQIWPSSFYEQKELTEAEYRKWFEESYRMLLGIPFSSGVSSLWMTFRINLFFKREKVLTGHSGGLGFHGSMKEPCRCCSRISRLSSVSR